MDNYPVYDYKDDKEFKKIISIIEKIPLIRKLSLPPLPTRKMINSLTTISIN
jgi:hypothetical protein